MRGGGRQGGIVEGGREARREGGREVGRQRGRTGGKEGGRGGGVPASFAKLPVFSLQTFCLNNFSWGQEKDLGSGSRFGFGSRVRMKASPE